MAFFAQNPKSYHEIWPVTLLRHRGPFRLNPEVVLRADTSKLRLLIASQTNNEFSHGERNLEKNLEL